jgi:PAS domain S-box-containing protein
VLGSGQRESLCSVHVDWRSLVQVASLAIVGLTVNGEVTIWNAAAERLFGWTTEEILGRPYPVVPPSKKEEYENLLQKVMQGYQFELMDVERQKKDGTPIWINVSCTPLRDESGLIVGALAIIADVTARVLTEQALEQRERFLRSLIDTAYNAFVAIDSEGMIVEWNLQAESTFGWKRNEVLTRSMADIIIPPRYRERHFRGLLHFMQMKEGVILNKRMELSAMHRDGHEFPVEITIWALPVGSRYIFNAFLHDISEQKKITSEREHLIAELTDALSKVHLLKGLIPICAACKKIRNDEGFWVDVEHYIRDHSEAEFTHGICPDCKESLYSEVM